METEHYEVANGIALKLHNCKATEALFTLRADQRMFSLGLEAFLKKYLEVGGENSSHGRDFLGAISDATVLDVTKLTRDAQGKITHREYIPRIGTSTRNQATHHNDCGYTIAGILTEMAKDIRGNAAPVGNIGRQSDIAPNQAA